MFLYFFIYLFVLFFSLLDFSIKKNREYDILYFLFSCFIFIVAAFRGMGNDYDGYEKIFDALKNLSILSIFDVSEVYVEPSYAILNIIVGHYLPYQTILIIMAFANVYGLFPFFRKYSPYPYISLLLYAGLFMYTGMMGLIRQSLAISICMWAIIAYKRRTFWILVGVAMTFHVSAAIVLLVRLIGDKFYTFKIYSLTVLIAIISNLFFYGLFKLIVAFMPTMIAWKLNIYLGTENGIRFGFNSAVAIRLFTFIISFCYRKKIQEHFPKYGPLFVNVYFLSLVIYVGCGFLPQMASRGGVYFHFMELLIVPMVLFSANKFNRAWIFTLYALFSLWRHIDMVTTYGDAYMPYKNILFS